MRTFDESGKSKKTVASMIESTTKEVPGGKKKAKPGACKYDRTFKAIQQWKFCVSYVSRAGYRHIFCDAVYHAFCQHGPLLTPDHNLLTLFAV